MALPSRSALEKLKLQFVARMVTPKYAIFYALRKLDGIDLFEAHYRMGFDQNRIGRCYISPKTWCIIKEEGFVAEGEDPRVFTSDGKNFVMDNTWGNASLLDQSNRYDRIKLNSTGKNLTIIPDGGRTLMVEWFKPLRVHETQDLVKNMWTPKILRHQDPDLSYRGGTPGYRCAEKSHFYGFGHRTLLDEKTIHRPFLWILNTANWKVETSDLDTCDCFSNNIVDPTSVVEHNNKLYLVTAESYLPWFTKQQEYYTCVYKIILD